MKRLHLCRILESLVNHLYYHHTLFPLANFMYSILWTLLFMLKVKSGRVHLQRPYSEFPLNLVGNGLQMPVTMILHRIASFSFSSTSFIPDSFNWPPSNLRFSNLRPKFPITWLLLHQFIHHGLLPCQSLRKSMGCRWWKQVSNIYH